MQVVRQQEKQRAASVFAHLRLHVLESRVGRRLIATFLLAALLPVAVLVAVVWGGLDRTLRTSQGEFAAQVAEAVAGQVTAELRSIDDTLSTIAASDSPRLPLPGGVAPSAAAVSSWAVIDAAGTVRASTGKSLSPAVVKRVAGVASVRGTRLVGVIDGSQRTLVLARTVVAGDGAPLVVLARLELSSLRRPSTSERAAAEFCLVVPRTAAQFCTGDHAPPPEAFAATPAGQLAHWNHRGEPMLALSVPLQAPLAADAETWSVTLLRSERPILDVLQGLQLSALVAAILAVAIALLLSLHQLRRLLVPLDGLMVAARSIADRNFSYRVKIAARDEFGRLGTAFNAMAERLGVHFRALNTFSEIDKTILIAPDTGRIAKLAMETLKEITQAEFVGIGVAEPSTPTQLRVYMAGATMEAGPPREIAWNPDPQDFLDRTTYGTWTDRPPVPNGFLHGFRAGRDTRFFVQVIARSQRVWGLIVLGKREPRELPNHRRALVRDIADRIAVALSTAERDRRLHVLAHLDGLTGLPNRQRLLSMLEQELAGAHAAHRRVGVLFIDLDRFKETNDTLGHAAGDTLLKRTAACIRERVRDADIVGRHGGDEFVVILRDVAGAADLGVVARKLVKALAKPIDIEGNSVYAGASVGIALFPDDGREANDLLKKADTAMYQAKDAGRGRFAFFSKDMDVAVNRRVTLHRQLCQALERNEFTLHFQPQVDLRSGRICAAEALVRWRHPVRGLLTPAHFIEVCEDTGLIEQVGKWVMLEACAQHRRWRDEGVDVPRVSVNVSSRQLRQPEFVASVDYAMVRAEMDPESLEIEVTESLILDGGKLAINALRALERSGARVAIDDFGTGYSSFTYLKTLPASILKLDKSFVSDIATDSDSATIASAIINMAHTLRKEVVAEGVETAAQLEFLRQAGCERVQGYLLSPPLPAERLGELVRCCERGGVAALIEATRRAPPALPLEPAPPVAAEGANATTIGSDTRLLAQATTIAGLP